MDSEIVSAIISAIGAILCAVVGYMTSLVSRPQEKKRSIHEKQMECLYEPMITMLEFGQHDNPLQMLSSIEQLFREQYRLLPKEYMDEYKRLRSLDTIRWDDFQRISEMVKIEYEASRLIYGYPGSLPFKKAKEYLKTPKYLLNYWTNSIYNSVTETGLFISTIILIFAAIMRWFDLDIGFEITDNHLVQMIFMFIYCLGFQWASKRK